MQHISLTPDEEVNSLIIWNAFIWLCQMELQNLIGKTIPFSVDFGIRQIMNLTAKVCH